MTYGGILKKKGTYKNGLYDGPYVVYGFGYGKNRVVLKYVFKEGIKEGPYETYYDDGTIYEKGIYKNNEIIDSTIFNHK